ncbi:MAG: UDP-N-acetylglucosamine 1-carboxyvinyltransferase [Desulfatibacillaceae bacterium]
MDKILIQGGQPLAGAVTISGAKNAALPCLAATLLCDGWCRLDNVPDLRDIRTINALLEHLGAEVERDGSTVRVNASGISPEREAPYDLVRRMRASILVLGPLVARLNRARVSLPGGCAIGARPIDLHLRGLEMLGAEVTLDHGYVDVTANGLRGSDIYMDMVTVTGTENLMMAAVLARGQTILRNAAREPEVVALADMLCAMGARITGAGTATITIDGVDRLEPVEHRVIPDRIEAGTFMAAAAITRGKVTLHGADPSHLAAVIHKLRLAGAQISVNGGAITVAGSDTIRSVDVKTQPFPGFATDMQAQFMALMCLGNGLSMINETIFENRFIHVSELLRMGADITVSGNSAVVRGVGGLLAAPVMATDLRASACLILAGLVARGETEVNRVYHLDRGYESIEKKLSALGARIRRESGE